jgi:hypothetical protein
MKINRITRVMAATVAAGAVTVSAIGFGGTASADAPRPWVPGQQPQFVNPVYNPFLNVRYNTPVLINGRWVYPYQNVAPNYVAPVYPYQYQAQCADVVVRLQQGRTLTAIAAERGIYRVTFYNAVVSTMRGSINVAVGGGAISPVTGNALQRNLNNRAGIVIDQPGTSSGTNAAVVETAYQLL